MERLCLILRKKEVAENVHHSAETCSESCGPAAVFTYSMARCGQGRPVRRWMERLLDFSPDDPV